MKKHFKKISIRSIAILLSVLLSILSFPLSVFAIEGNADADLPISKSVEKDIIELIDERTATTKRFRLEDGSYMVAQYDTDVHYLDENGTWQNIDNTLAVSGSDITTSDAKIKFAKKTTGNETLFALHDGNRKLTLSLNGAAKKVAGEITNYDSELGEDTTKLEKMTTLNNISASVLYSEILPNTDLEYVIKGKSIKENIIVKSKADAYSYTFTLSLNNLTASLNADNVIEIFDANTEELAYRIPAPVMWDANYALSNDISVTLTDLGNGNYTLMITPSAEWMNDEERAFPVTVDPTITTTAQNATSSAFVASNNTSSGSSTATISVGKSADGVEYIGLNKLTTLPTLPQNAVVTDATLHLTTSATQGAANDFVVALYKVMSSWNSETVSYSTLPTINSTMVDYCRMKENSSMYIWNITSLVKDWYENTDTNYGVAIKVPNTVSGTCLANFYTSSHSYEYARPTYQIRYRDTKGIESYYDYYPSSADGAGVGYVNSFNGNLVFLHDSLSTTDSLMPYTFGLAYNGALANKKYNAINACTPGFNASTGKGFKLYTDETIIPTIIDGEEYYIWADADGTEHYFSEQSYTRNGVSEFCYCDEDGLQLYLDAENYAPEYVLYDDVGNIKRFNCNGYLIYIEDVNGNRRVFDRSLTDETLETISLVPNGSSSIEQLSFAYSNGVLTRASNLQTGLTADFYYSDTYNGTVSQSATMFLRKIVYTYSSSATYTVTFEYDSSGRLIFAKDLKTAMAIEYSYDTMGRVTQMTQYANATETSTASSMTVGQRAGIIYANGQTSYRSSGKDDIYNNSDDIYTIYRFDHTGKVVSSYTTDESNIYGASNYAYEDDSSVKTKNSLSSVMTIGGSTPNYLSNPGFSAGNLSCWTKNGNVTYNEGLSLSNNDGGVACLAVGGSNASSAYLEQNFAAIFGTYTLSAEVNRGFMKPNTHARLVIYNMNYEQIAASDYVEVFETDFILSTIWERISVTFEVDDPDCFDYAWYVRFEVSSTDSSQSQTSHVYVDNFMLERANGAGKFSELGNGGFEMDINTWTTTSAGYLSDEQFEGGYSLRATGHTNRQAYAKAVISQVCDGEEDDDGNRFMSSPLSFVISGWGKATSVDTEYPENLGTNTNRLPIYALKVVLNYYNDNIGPGVYYIPFNDDITDWQFVSGVVTSQANVNGQYPCVADIEVYCCYDYNAGLAFFDGISVVKDSNCVTSYSYNELGYLSGTHTSDGTGTDYTYSSNQVDVTNVQTDTNEYQATYDAKHRVTSAVNSNGTTDYVEYYTYDSYGNVVETLTEELFDCMDAILTSATYSTNSSYFGALQTETDATGGVSRYFYDSKGRLMAVSGADGNGLIYNYNDYGQMNGAVLAVYNSSTNSMNIQYSLPASVSYRYNSKGQTDRIMSDTATYYFFYDVFGNTTSINVDDRTLVSYQYAANNGKMTKQTYGNGDFIEFLYDGVDRVVGICYNGSTTARFSYIYNANGQITKHTDLSNGINYAYSYDADGKLTQTTAKRASDDRAFYHTVNRYDELNRLTYVYHYYGDTNAAPMSYTQYTYDSENGAIKKVYHGGAGVSTNYTYDAFGRLSVKQLGDSLGATSYVTNSYYYNYHDTAEDYDLYGTSGQIQFVSTQDASGFSSTYYTYDAVGNITEICQKRGSTELAKRTYKYDKLGQLSREDVYIAESASSSFTMEYIYDNSGNILYKRKYAYTTATSLLGLSYTEIAYSYREDYDYEADENIEAWNDILESYNGIPILYDEIGNPIQIIEYDDGSDYVNGYRLEWEGRQLIAYHYGEGYSGDVDEYYDTIEFKYNADGIRTQKIINGLKHEYVTSGSQIEREIIYSYNGVYIAQDIRYFYDAEGKPTAIRHYMLDSTGAVTGDTIYYLGTNLQGDVIAIYDSTGTKIYTYEYDAWGNLIRGRQLATGGSVANSVNPFRYRGYYYDIETGLYYLQSRYYNPQWGRFLNADGYLNGNGDLLGYNMFAYCSNNPINGYDPTGKWTYSIGYSFSMFFGGGSTYSISLAFDSSGNIAIQTSQADIFKKENGATLGAASIGVSKSYSFTTLGSVDDLNGQALNSGGSVPIYYGLVSVGGEAISSPDAPLDLVGGSISAGVGAGVDVHVVASKTETKGKFNIFESIKNAWNSFTSWIGG